MIFLVGLFHCNDVVFFLASIVLIFNGYLLTKSCFSENLPCWLYSKVQSLLIGYGYEVFLAILLARQDWASGKKNSEGYGR